MSESKILNLLKRLEAAELKYFSIIAELEDTKLDIKTKQKATKIIKNTQIHSEIALEQIQS